MEDCTINRWQQLKSQLNNLSPKLFKKAAFGEKDVILIDCRTPEEFASSRLKNAVNFNYLSKNLVEELERFDIEKTYFVYCRSERRSIRVCTLMKNGGFKNVYNLEGGLIKWVEEFGEDSLERTQS